MEIEKKREPSLVKFYRFIRGIGYVRCSPNFRWDNRSDLLRKICIDP